jgi:GH15 family glucan-1,4-alpha-glucosidase
MPYSPIESYGVIGDLHTVALVGQDGSIDWCCLPDFDSPSVFARILDDQRGGFYRIHSREATRSKQMYLPETNVLLTRYYGRDALGEVTDFMPVQPAGKRARDARHQIIRHVKAVRGRMRFELECAPAFDYARATHQLRPLPNGVMFETATRRMALFCTTNASESAAAGPTGLQDGDVVLRMDGSRVLADFNLNEGESATFVLRQQEGGESGFVQPPGDPDEELLHTIEFWRNWLSQCEYKGRWREMVERSALVLKLLTYQPTGAIVAAPTCSLPEEIGGERNWDYRYTWIRDAAFTVYAFLRLGFTNEAEAFMQWLQNRIGEEVHVNGPLQVLYRIDGRHHVPEEHLDHLQGYRDSRPVRVGNLAAKQFQLDIYGALIDSIYLFDKYHTRISYDLWRNVLRMLDFVIDNWQKPDDGIWEVRGGQQQFVYSKLQCWVALDRALRMALKYGLPIDFARVRDAHDRIYREIMDQGYHRGIKAFVQHYGSDAMDAANLMMPLTHFCSPRDPRILGTIDRIMEELSFGSLVHRYAIGKGAGDGLSGKEGTFSICSFWLVEALTRAGRVDEALLNFEKMLTYANHLGLYAEEIGPSGEALGNFPQAFTHLGLISAAFNLDRALG